MTALASSVSEWLRNLAPFALAASMSCGGKASGSGAESGSPSPSSSGNATAGSAAGVGSGLPIDASSGSQADAASGLPLDSGAESGVETGPLDAAGDFIPCGPPPPGCARLGSPEVCAPGYVCDPTLGTGNPGDSCTEGDSCMCTSAGWLCSATCGGGECVAVDAATPGASCPAAQPNAGDACIGPIACKYQGLCGLVVLECSTTKSYWAVKEAAKCEGECPVSEPKVGDPCMAGGKCSYVSGCGDTDTVFCDGDGTVSMIMAGICPACPSQEPAPLSPCAAPQSCMFTNTCGGTDMATCSMNVWNVLRGDCEM